MIDIHGHLRDFRLARGLTQEAVARQMGLTRQAVSSHESGRTEPDIGTLMRYGEVYGVSLSDILYGGGRAERQQRRLRRAAWAAGLGLAGCNAFWAGVRWAASRFFPVEEGTMTDAGWAVWEQHRRLMDLSRGVEGFSLAAFFLAVLLLTALALRMERPVPVRRKLGCLGVLAVLALGAVLPWALTDPVFGLPDYTVAPVRQIIWAASATLVLLAADRFRGKRT